MDTDGSALEEANETNFPGNDSSTNESQTNIRNATNSIDLKSPKENVNRRKKKIKVPESSIDSQRAIEASTSINENEIELQSISDEENDREQTFGSDFHGIDSPTQIDQATMLSSFTTAGDSDVIEIHQFSENDIDPYLDIFFDTLHNRLRHYIGGEENLQQFRNLMKTRIKSSTNAREYQNVLLGKINDDVVAAVTMSFSDEPSTIPSVRENPNENSCLKSVKSWFNRHANYVPTMTNECYIEMIGVKSSFQNRGIGAAMLQCVEHFAQQAGASSLTIHVAGEQLRNYFQRFGFEIDRSDYSSFWKWIVEREAIFKLQKNVSHVQEGGEYSNASYYGDSIVGNAEE